jgi:hypothetical protein
VQSPAAIDRATGEWQLTAYFGDRTAHVGKPYEMRAVIGPRQALATGKVLPGWPDAKMMSPIIGSLIRDRC